MNTTVGQTFDPSRASGGPVRLRTLILLRWLAVAGQLISILTVHYSLGFAVPLAPALGAVAVSVGINLLATVARPAATRLSDRDAAFSLGYDVVQLAVLLALTGGLQNPFSVLFLVPVTISATILSLRSTAALCGLVLVSASIVALFHWPLPWPGEGMTLPPLYLVALWVALVLGTITIASYTWRIAAEARRMANALTATQMALAREQRLSALGALAAAAAHELGTPLGTIAVVAKEMARDLLPGSAQAEDVALLASQTARCREILGRLAGLGEAEADTPYGRLPISGLAESAAAPHRRDGAVIEVTGRHAGGDQAPEPLVSRRAEIVHGLGNFIENAVQFCRQEVAVVVEWDRERISIEILDDGPGFAPGILQDLGEPYLSTRRQAGRMGLGVFIAKILLERTGAGISFSKRPTGGARVVVAWPRAVLESMPSETDPATHAVRQSEVAA